MVELLPVPAAILDSGYHILYANRRFHSLAGLGQKDMPEAPLLDLFEVAAPEGGGIRRMSIEGRFFNCHMERLESEDRLLCLMCEDSLSGAALRKVDLLDLVEHANDLIQCVGPDGSILYVNRAWKETLGYNDDEIRGLKFWDIISSECMDHCRQMYGMLLEGKSLDRFETVFLAKDGRPVYLEGSVNGRFEGGRLVNTRGIFRDITEKKRAEEEARRLQERLIASQRYESLGILAGGIAHDFNNILMAILGFAELIKLRPEASPEIMKYIDRIEGSAKRAADLTGQMLAFSGMSLLSKEKLFLSDLLTDAVLIIEATASKKIQFIYDIEKAGFQVEADRNQLLQALINLISNAVEAIGDSKGTITIETGRVEADEALFQRTVGGDEAVPGLYCYIRVSDTGPGMRQEVQSKAFDPFFSTKFTGRGLGLPATLGIVRSHQGALELESAPGRGTAVTIYLPVSSAEGVARLIKSNEARLDQRKPLVLVIDDEPLVRELLENYLEDLDFRAIFAANGREGLEHFVAEKSDIDLVILDLLMPEIDGFELLRHIKALKPQVPVVIISGYEKSNVADRIPDGHMAAFLRKPFSIAELEEILKGLFGRPA